VKRLIIVVIPVVIVIESRGDIIIMLATRSQRLSNITLALVASVHVTLVHRGTYMSETSISMILKAPAHENRSRASLSEGISIPVTLLRYCYVIVPVYPLSLSLSLEFFYLILGIITSCHHFTQYLVIRLTIYGSLEERTPIKLRLLHKITVRSGTRVG